jgi:hypothetical protein
LYLLVLPYIVQGISVLFVGILADYMTCKIKVRVVIVRRIAQIISGCGFATFLLLVSKKQALFYVFNITHLFIYIICVWKKATYVAKTPLQGIVLISIGTGLGSFAIAGFTISQVRILV